ncbi:protein IL-40 isoform X2 [Molossus molossus]|nr:protein IL-40 isoform X2 [Molossus molossus]
MRLLLLFCLALLASGSFSVEQKIGLVPEVTIAYQVLEVFPRSRRVLITCHSPQGTPPIAYSLWGSQDIEVARKVVKKHTPASFSINVTLKSRPDLLTYTCQAATSSGPRGASTTLQMYWELWAKGVQVSQPCQCFLSPLPEPVSQLQTNFTLLDRGSGPRVEMSCRASLGSPPITYSLVGPDGHVHLQQRPHYGQPANFSFLLTETPRWFQCQAQNDINVQSSPLTLVPPGQLPRGPTFVLAASLTSIAAIASGMLGRTTWTR